MRLDNKVAFVTGAEIIVDGGIMVKGR